jgi:hypothetical protein
VAAWADAVCASGGRFTLLNENENEELQQVVRVSLEELPSLYIRYHGILVKSNETRSRRMLPLPAPR